MVTIWLFLHVVMKISYTCFPKVYNLYNNITRGDVILVFGKVEKRLNELQIIVSKITKLN